MHENQDIFLEFGRFFDNCQDDPSFVTELRVEQLFFLLLLHVHENIRRELQFIHRGGLFVLVYRNWG